MLGMSVANVKSKTYVSATTKDEGENLVVYVENSLPHNIIWRQNLIKVMYYKKAMPMHKKWQILRMDIKNKAWYAVCNKTSLNINTQNS